MTKPQLDNQPYHHLLEALNAALPLEYAIRAGQELYAKEFERLKGFSATMAEAWSEAGYSEEVIRRDRLVDICWDMLQLGYVEDRNPVRVWTAEDFAYLVQARNKVVALVAPSIGTICLPFADRYRVCDLLNGNNIAGLITEIQRKKSDFYAIKAEDSVPFSKFVLSIRTPIPRYRGAEQQVHIIPPGSSTPTHIGVMLDPNMSLADVDGALHEFLYHYAMFRKSNSAAQAYDPVVNTLLQRWGKLAKPPGNAEVTQANELLVALNGLYCWDRRRQHAAIKERGSTAKAIDDVQALYPENAEPTTEAISSHYRKVKKRIDRVCNDELQRQKNMIQLPIGPDNTA